MRDKVYAKAFSSTRDPDFFKSVAAPRILRAGFLLPHPIISITGRRAKETFIDNLPLEVSALLSAYDQFFLWTVTQDGLKTFPGRITNTPESSLGKVGAISRVVLEVTLFESLKASKDCIQATEDPANFQGPAELVSWARAFTARYIAGNDVTVAKEYDASKSHSRTEESALLQT